MKKLMIYMMMIATVAVSCLKEGPLDGGSSDESPAYSYSFMAAAGNDLATKVAFEPADKSFTWNQGDQVILLFKESAEKADYRVFKNDRRYYPDIYLPFVAGQEGSKTTFTVQQKSNMELDRSKSYDYKAVFPFPKQIKNETDPLSYSLPSAQNGQFIPEDCLMYAYLENAPALPDGLSESNIDFRFHHLMTFLSFSIQDPDRIADTEQDLEIYGFEMEFPRAVAGDFTIYPKDGNEKGLPFTVRKGESKLRVILANPIFPTDRYEPLNAAVITCLPFTIEAGEHFTVTILARSSQYGNIRQTVVCAPGGKMDCPAGHFRKIALQLNAADLKKTNDVTPVGGSTIQQMLGDPDFAPAVLPGNHQKIYGRNDYTHYVKAGQVMTAASRVLTLTTPDNRQENVIILDNTVSSRWSTSATTQSTFLMPVETVLPNFYEMDYEKDLEVTFKANILLSGSDVSWKSSEKVDAPLWIALNHCNESTWKNGDRGFRRLKKVTLPKANVSFSKKDICKEGYPYPGTAENPKPWVEYKVVLPAKELPFSEFEPNSDGTPAYIGFKIDDFGTTGNRMLIYLKDISFREVNRRKKPVRTWMADVSGTTRLADLSIPGAHDAATGNLSNGSKRCQHLSLREQLEIGVRALDLRPAATPDLMIYHASVPTGVTFAAAIDTIDAFLKENPTETVIVLMKNESGDAQTWARLMGDYLKANGDREVSPGKKLFASFKKGLTLDDVRGQLLLLSRADYQGDVIGASVDVRRWSDGTNESRTTIYRGSESENLWVQDNYWFTTTFNQKFKVITNLLQKSRADKNHEWYFNYVSISGSSPMENAVILNADIFRHLRYNPGKSGILFMDFAGQPYSKGDLLVDMVIAQNPGTKKYSK